MLKADTSTWSIDETKRAFSHWSAFEQVVINHKNVRNNAAEQKIFQKAKAFFFRLTYLTRQEQDIMAKLYYDESQQTPQSIADEYQVDIKQVNTVINAAYKKMLDPKIKPLSKRMRTTANTRN